MGAFANCAKPIECGNAECGGEVSVRTTSDRRLLQIPIELLRDLGGFLIERDHAASPFHRRTIDSAFEDDLALWIEWLKRLEPAIQIFSSVLRGDADIDDRFGFSRDDIGSSATARHTYIESGAVIAVREFGQAQYLPRQF